MDCHCKTPLPAIDGLRQLPPGVPKCRATLALAWPLILANLTMQMIQATDVVLMGWLGPRQLAASALALNLTFAFSIALHRDDHRRVADDGDRARQRARARCAMSAAPFARPCGWRPCSA